MAVKNIIAKGIGFAPGTKKWIPTHGFSIGAAPVLTSLIVTTQSGVSDQNTQNAVSDQDTQSGGVG